MKQAHFYHANGFPVQVYGPLADILSKKFDLSMFESSALKQDNERPPKNRNWQLYADELIQNIEANYSQPIVGIGHSMGATCTALAALKRPDLFSELILVEPAMVSPFLATVVRLLPKKVMLRINPAKGTLKKKDSFISRREFFDHIRKFSGYRNFNPKVLALMAEYGVRECRDGSFQLSFSKQWEAHNYTQPPTLINKLKGLQTPCSVIRGTPNQFFTDSYWQKIRKHRGEGTILLQDLRYGHLMPMEAPEACADLILASYQELVDR